MIHNFNDDGFDSLDPKYSGGRPPTFTLPQRRQVKKIALGRPADHDPAFSTWSLSQLAEFLVAERVVDDISHEGLRLLEMRTAVGQWLGQGEPGSSVGGWHSGLPPVSAPVVISGPGASYGIENGLLSRRCANRGWE